jgi:hypothetical protein
MADKDANGKMISSTQSDDLSPDTIEYLQTCTLSHDDCVTGGDRGHAAAGTGRSSSSQNVPQEVTYRGKPS